MAVANFSYSVAFAVPTHQHSQQQGHEYASSTMPLPTSGKKMSTSDNNKNSLVDQLIGHVQNIPQEETNPEEIQKKSKI
jgi:hypothetical protein